MTHICILRKILPTFLITLVLTSAQLALAGPEITSENCKLLSDQQLEYEKQIQGAKDTITANNAFINQMQLMAKKKSRSYWIGLPITTVYTTMMMYGYVRSSGLLTEKDITHLNEIKDIVMNPDSDKQLIKNDTKFKDIIEKYFIIDNAKIADLTVWMHINSKQIDSLTASLQQNNNTLKDHIATLSSKKQKVEQLVLYYHCNDAVDDTKNSDNSDESATEY